jgi:hypothetical protein
MAQIDSVFEFQLLGGSLELVAQNDVTMYGGVEDTYSQELNVDYEVKDDLFEGYNSDVSDNDFVGGDEPNYDILFEEEINSDDIAASNPYEELFDYNPSVKSHSTDEEELFGGYSSEEIQGGYPSSDDVDDVYDLLGGVDEDSDEEPHGVISF